MMEAISGMVGGLTSIAGGMIGGGKRRREQAAAEKELSINKARYENLDTSNLAANMENAYEDLTVNTQAADFAAQQQQQGLANTMSGMSAAAGGSGIAALAQAMAGQQSQNLQGASASIAQQESANQAKAAQGAMSVQSAQIQGAQASREAEAAKTETLLGMSQERKGAADDARAAATEAITSGIGDTIGGAASLMSGGGMMDSLPMSDRRLKENIKIIGRSPSGLRIYAFEYINKLFGKGRFQGVMSDEIPKKAVVKHYDGYDRVDYSKLDVEFKQINLDYETK